MDEDFEMANRIFIVCVEEDLQPLSSSKTEMVLSYLNRWREYFGDLLNPVDATTSNTHDEQAVLPSGVDSVNSAYLLLLLRLAQVGSVFFCLAVTSKRRPSYQNIGTYRSKSSNLE